MSSEFEKYSLERKELVQKGEVPEWYTTQGWIMFKRKYAAHKGETIRDAFKRVASHLSKYVSDIPEAENKFFTILWNGWLSASTPILCNAGTDRGHLVSCSGGYFEDTIDSFYTNHHENAMLSKHGYGTSSYMGDIRPRGASISVGGNADGIVPVIDSAVDVMRKVSQGNNRRGQWAGYVPVDHGDFWELSDYIQKNPASVNIGWNFSDDFIDRLVHKDPEAIKQFNRVMYLRTRTGKGYIHKVDVANRLTTQAIKNSGITIKGSNLCCVTGDTKITLKIGEHLFDTNIEYLGEILKTAPTNSILVKSFNINTHDIEWKPISAFALTRKKAKLIKIKDVISGKELRCTPDHQIFTKNRGYVEAQHLIETDELVIE